MERELIRHQGGQLRFDSLLLVEKSKKMLFDTEEKSDEALNLDEAMSLHISKVLRLTKGKIHGSGGAAELLGINPNTLRGRMRKLGVLYGRKTK